MIDEIRCQVMKQVWLSRRKVAASDLIQALLQFMVLLIKLTGIVPAKYINNNSPPVIIQIRCTVVEYKVYKTLENLQTQQKVSNNFISSFLTRPIIFLCCLQNFLQSLQNYGNSNCLNRCYIHFVLRK